VTAAEWAARLNGREVGSEFRDGEAFGASVDDVLILNVAEGDLVELSGLFTAELWAYTGCEFYLTEHGPIEDGHECDCPYCGYASAVGAGVKVNAVWSDDGSPCWRFTLDVPHSTFEIMEGGEVFCRGVVVAKSDLFPQEIEGDWL
jgi:hypothetical protein